MLVILVDMGKISRAGLHCKIDCSDLRLILQNHLVQECMNKSEQATTAQANHVMDPSFPSCDAIEVVEFGLVIV